MIQKNKSNKTYLFILILFFGFNLSTNTFAQSNNEDFYEEDMIEEEFIDEGEDEYDYESSNIYEETQSIDDPNGDYKLNDKAVVTFQKITDLERKNALMKLEIEQGKLKLDLEKQKTERKKMNLNIEDEEKNRALKREELERKANVERKKAREEDDKYKEEQTKKRQSEEISKKVMERLNSGEVTNPEEIQALTQLLATASGEKINPNKGTSSDKKVISFDEKYVVKSIAGAGGNLVATIENTEKKNTFKAKNGSLIDGWIIESIKSSSILLKKDGEAKVMYLNQ